MYIGLNVKYLLLLSACNQNRGVYLQIFIRIPNCHLTKTVRPESKFKMRTAERTDVKILTAALRSSFANVKPL